MGKHHKLPTKTPPPPDVKKSVSNKESTSRSTSSRTSNSNRASNTSRDTPTASNTSRTSVSPTITSDHARDPSKDKVNLNQSSSTSNNTSTCTSSTTNRTTESGTPLSALRASSGKRALSDSSSNSFQPPPKVRVNNSTSTSPSAFRNHLDAARSATPTPAEWCPDQLRIFKSDTIQGPVSRSEWYSIRDNLLKFTLEYLQTHGPQAAKTIRSNNSYFEPSLACGIITCLSDDAKRWVKEAIAEVTNHQFRAWSKGEHEFIYLKITIPNGFDAIDDVTYLETALLYHPELTKCNWTVKRKFRLMIKDAKGAMVEKGKRALIIQSLPPALDYVKRVGSYLPPHPDGPASPAWLLNGLYSQFRVSVASAADLIARAQPQPPTLSSPPKTTERAPPTPIQAKIRVDEFVANPNPNQKIHRQLFQHQAPHRVSSGLSTINESLERTDLHDTPSPTHTPSPTLTPTLPNHGLPKQWADDIDSDVETELMDAENSTDNTDAVIITPEDAANLLQ